MHARVEIVKPIKDDQCDHGSPGRAGSQDLTLLLFPLVSASTLRLNAIHPAANREQYGGSKTMIDRPTANEYDRKS